MLNYTVNKAAQLLGEGEMREAARHLHRLVERDPDNGDAWFLLAYAQSSIDRRREYLRRAVSLLPGDDVSRRELAYLESLPDILTQAQRAELLQRELGRYLRYGWRVESKTDTTAKLVMHEKFSRSACCLFGLFYMVKRAGDPDKTLFIEVAENGNVAVY